MSSNIRYVCPECGHRGSNPPEMDAPLCDKCDYKVEMIPERYMSVKKNIEERAVKNAEEKRYIDYSMKCLGEQISSLAEEKLPCVRPLMEIEKMLKILLKRTGGA